MLSTEYVFNFLLELLRHMSHGSPQVCELVWAFETAEVLGGDTPDFRRKMKMRWHRHDCVVRVERERKVEINRS